MTASPKRNAYHSSFQAYLQSIYNKEEGKYLGRDAKSWGKVEEIKNKF